jgi:hypothetical protein
MCYHPVFGVSVISCSGIASFAGFGGRSALLILVRVALLLPSDDEPVSAFAFPGSGKQAAVAELQWFLSCPVCKFDPSTEILGTVQWLISS